MHETVIARTIIVEAQKHGSVKAITLEIGQLASVPMSDLLSCLKSLVNWEINAVEKKAVCTCSCGYVGHPRILERAHDSFIVECPSCEGVPRIIEGIDIVIVSVRVQ